MIIGHRDGSAGTTTFKFQIRPKWSKDLNLASISYYCTGPTLRTGLHSGRKKSVDLGCRVHCHPAHPSPSKHVGAEHLRHGRTCLPSDKHTHWRHHCRNVLPTHIRHNFYGFFSQQGCTMPPTRNPWAHVSQPCQDLPSQPKCTCHPRCGQ